MDITTVGIDLAKNVFSVHGVDAHGKPGEPRRTVATAERPGFLFIKEERCLLGIEPANPAALRDK